MRTPCLLIVFFLLAPHLVGGSESLTPLGRETTDRDGDLQRRLLDSGMAQVAEAICRKKVAGFPPGSEDSAKWVIRLSRALTEQAIRRKESEDPSWNEAADILDGWLSGYESSPRAPWVRLARVMIDFRRSQLQTLRHLASPENRERQQTALALVRQCATQLETLIKELTELAPLAEIGRRPGLASGGELRVVLATAQRQLIRTLLARAELYPDGSDDRISAALQAGERARRQMSVTAMDDPAMADIARLECEAWLRAGDVEKADDALRVLTGRSRQPADGSPATANEGQLLDVAPETLALMVRIAIAEQKLPFAKELLEYYYGEDSLKQDALVARAAPHPLDLARLEYLVAQSKPNIQAANDWADAITARHGAYYGRLAGLRVLSALGSSSAGSDPRMLAGAGGAMLRRGEFLAAASQFARAADAATAASDIGQGFSYRLQSGAAYQKGGDVDSAAEQLAMAASGMPSHKSAPAANFQAAYLLGKAGWKDKPERARRFVEILSEHMQRWPAGPMAQRARPVLSAQLESERRWAEAARLWSSGDVVTSAGEEDPFSRAARLWRAAVRQSASTEQRGEAVIEATLSLRAARPDEALLLSALWDDIQQLKSHELPAAQAAIAGAQESERSRLTFGLHVAKLRLGETLLVPVPASGAEQEPWAFDLIARLGADAASGQTTLAAKQKIAALSKDHINEARTLSQQEVILSALVESGQWDIASELSGKLKPIRGASLIGRLAEMLLEVDKPKASEKAIELLRRYSRGLPKGSDAWAKANLRVCRTYVKLGDREGAAKVARYLLLTSPPKEEALLQEFKRFAEIGDP